MSLPPPIIPPSLLPPSTPPLLFQPRLQKCVCSIAEDYSVAILSTSERKCLLVAAVHSAPVRDVAWRLREDFLLVSCTDGKLYVWQIETGIHVHLYMYIHTCSCMCHVIYAYILSLLITVVLSLSLSLSHSLSLSLPPSLPPSLRLSGSLCGWRDS